MELDEWIRVLPMPAGRVATVDERDVHIRVIDQRVREGHAHRARAHDEVVGLQRSASPWCSASSRIDEGRRICSTRTRRVASTLAALPAPFTHEVVELLPVEFEDLSVSLRPPIDGATTDEQLAEELAIVAHLHHEISVEMTRARGLGSGSGALPCSPSLVGV